jgi:class III poly(R)-hydroxyalkanoic acid synthase PhaE subunit
MTWNDQAESMMKVWTEAQRTMWQGWYDAVQTASAPAMFNPGMLEEWRKLATQGLEMWNSGIDPAFRNVSRQMMASQSAMMQMLQMTTSAWQSMAPKLDAGQDWNTVLTTYVEQMRQQMMPDAKGMVQTAQDSTEMWKMYMQHMQGMLQPWTRVAEQFPNALSGAMAGNGSKGFIDLTSMAWEAFGGTFDKLSHSPSFGITRELEEKIAKAYDAWKEMQQSSNDYQVMMAEAWSGVFEQVLQQMKSRAEQDKPVESMRDLMTLWLSAADRSFDKVFRSETYAHVQGRFVTNTMKYRIREQEVVEEFMKATYIPTRSEMDEAHRNIYELRKEVKRLKKSLAATDKPKGRGKKNEQPVPEHQG